MPQKDGATKAQQLILLENLLLSAPDRHWRTAELAELLGLSPDTITRYIDDLGSQGMLPVIQHGSTRDRTWTVDTTVKRLPALRLDYAQGAALYAAARLLSQQQDERNDAVRGAILQILAVLPNPLRSHLDAIVRSFGDLAAGRADMTQTFSALAQGWLSQRVVKLTYEPAHRSVFTSRFHPYLLEPSGIGHTLYFIGLSTPPGKLRTFKLERIRQAEVTEEPFEIPASFDGQALLQQAWGVMFGDQEPIHIRLRFSHQVGRRIHETRWHSSERVTDTPEGVIWEADIGDITEIRPWVRGWGADCEVLEPATLRDELLTEVRRMARVYAIPLGGAPADPTGPDATLLNDLLS